MACMHIEHIKELVVGALGHTIVTYNPHAYHGTPNYFQHTKARNLAGDLI